jgi:hypothetical protein
MVQQLPWCLDQHARRARSSTPEQTHAPDCEAQPVLLLLRVQVKVKVASEAPAGVRHDGGVMMIV